MIIVKLSGGIGNQLFQYAAARRLSLIRRVPLKFDLTGFEKEPNRSYALGIFNVGVEMACRTENQRMRSTRVYGRRHLPLLWLERFGLLDLPRVYTHLDPAFYPPLLSAGGKCYLEGYWQSEEYFRDCEKRLRKELTFRCDFRPEIQSLANTLKSQYSLSLHVRRGDYVSNSDNLLNHGVCSASYYKRALEWCLEKHRIDTIVVFSDDPEWVSCNLELPHGTLNASKITTHDYEDLFLMTHCRFHVIANSSFSWWGAWLANAPPDQVVAPVQWFANPQLDSSMIVPPGWRRF